MIPYSTRLGLARRLFSAVCLLTVLSLAEPASSASAAQRSGQWCGTHILWLEELAEQAGDGSRAAPACPEYGACDNAATRAAWIPDSTDPITTVALVVHVLYDDAGNNPVSSDAEVNSNIAQLNQDYLPVRIQFEHTINHVHSTHWRYLLESQIDAMKFATAIKPDSQLNIWVTNVDFGYSFGTFPWQADALTTTGGIVMGHFHWGSANSVLAHEVGHCLGLYHTFNGVDEVTECGPCYEYVGASGADVLGDRCDDTPPHPLTYQCANVSGTDVCSGLHWGYTMPENYMGYSPEWCYTTFTPKQAGRIHCWLDDQLSSWVIGVQFVATNTFGPVPLEVTFDASANRSVDEWQWDFGDEGTSGEEDPVYLYEQAGYYDVVLTIQTTDGPYSSLQPGLVSAYADTLFAEDAEFSPGTTAQVDILARNHLPLGEITVAFNYDGPIDLKLDSVSNVGLRSEDLAKSVPAVDPFGKNAVVKLEAGTGPYLEPGEGSVVRLFFHDEGSSSNSTNTIELITFGMYDPEFITYAGTYEPETVDGSITAGCCIDGVGNVNGSAVEKPDIADMQALIDHLFINMEPLGCLEEADVDLSGQTAPPAVPGNIDIADMQLLIDHLFVNMNPLPPCP